MKTITGEDSAIWLAELVRLTVFLTEVGASPGPSWEEVMGREPESVSQQRKISLTQETGPVNETYTLVRRHEPSRVDWGLAATDVWGEDQNSLASPRGVAENLLSLLKPWFEESTPVSRIAFGAVLLKPVSSRAEGHKILGGFLPGVKIPDDSRDFSYRINRPRHSKVIPELDINRLSTWNVQEERLFHVLGGEVAQSTPRRFAVKLDLDINTVPEPPVLLETSQVDLIKELIDLTIEITEEGDIP